jgi:hypothetical protein
MDKCGICSEALLDKGGGGGKTFIEALWAKLSFQSVAKIAGLCIRIA